MPKEYNKIVTDSLNSITYRNDVSYKDLVLAFKKTLLDNVRLMGSANLVDLRNGNGNTFFFPAIENIFDRVLREEKVYGTVTLSRKDEEKGFIYGQQIFNKGNVLVIYDGNTYLLIELIIRNILANNAVIFNYHGYNSGLNTLIIKFIQGVLESSGLNPLQVQEYISDDLEILNCTKSFDLVIASGDHTLQRDVLIHSHVPVLTLGYGNYDIYLESDKNLDFVDEIIGRGFNCNLYVLEDIKIDREVNYVSDINEAISEINLGGSLYAATIFTDNLNNASSFIEHVKCMKVTVNSSPLLDDVSYIKQSDLYIEKTIIYPFDLQK